MPYPSKLDRGTVLQAALAQVAHANSRQISLRALAVSLGVAPNALYRYFPDRARLEAAVSGAVTRRLHDALIAAVGRRNASSALRSLAKAYIEFAMGEPGLYRIFLGCDIEDEENAAAHDALWEFVCAQVARLTGGRKAAPAAIALWSMLHGLVDIAAAEAIDADELACSFEFGVGAWLLAATRSTRTKRA